MCVCVEWYFKRIMSGNKFTFLVNRYYDLYAKNIMRTDLLFISYNTTYGELRHLLNTSVHASYPLVDNSGKSNTDFYRYYMCSLCALL